MAVKIASGKNKNKGVVGNYPVYGSTGVIAWTNAPIFHKAMILVARVGANAGFVHLAEGDYDITDNTLYIDLDNSINIRFLYYQLVSMNINQYAKGGGQPLITGGLLKDLEIPIPSLEEQERIVAILDRFDTLVNDLSKGLPAEIEARKQQYEYYRDKLLDFKRR
ncbi:restriction endonuclease subunit S [Sodaliphilus sp.]|uniref:restriction endonuclease subunit S n=1 Tax=Sodaliphilus sp. TaxID=2815818 RepID=UPI0038906AC3